MRAVLCSSSIAARVFACCLFLFVFVFVFVFVLYRWFFYRTLKAAWGSQFNLMTTFNHDTKIQINDETK